MSRYAKDTKVTVDRSRAEIETTLDRYGASGFGYIREGDRAAITFRCHNRTVRFVIDMPDINDQEFQYTETGRTRDEDVAWKHWQKACRQRWRALALVVKAKLEAVESGIAEFEEEFLAHIVLPDGSTVADFMLPQVARAYELNAMPSMLPGLPAAPDDVEEAEFVDD